MGEDTVLYVGHAVMRWRLLEDGNDTSMENNGIGSLFSGGLILADQAFDTIKLCSVL